MSPDVPDIEIGRHALRTFRLSSDNLQLKSLFQSVIWSGGVMTAECRKSAEESKPRCKKCPGEGCHCGLYGTLTLDHLLSQYHADAVNSVAVIAAEGDTLIGDRGLRTSAARIVAYWTDHPTFVTAYANCCPGAQRFTDIFEMLKAYKFPSPTCKSYPPPNQRHEFIPLPVPKKMDPNILINKHPALTAAGISALKHILGYT
jgi:hypothetical protein